MRSFGSDNNSGVHPQILEALRSANEDHSIGYGDDPWTRACELAFQREFGEDTFVYPVFGGTGANVLALHCVLQAHEAIICSSHAHLHIDETGAPDRIISAKILPFDSPDGKLSPAALEHYDFLRGEIHGPQPRVVSITQSTEFGLVYSPEEVRSLADAAHERGMLLHMDGARIANAAAALGLELREATRELGVDILSFGATKNGAMFGEAVVFFSGDLARLAPFLRKQVTQLASKMRFLSVQLTSLLEDELWKKNAAHANQMAVLLADKLEKREGVNIIYPVQSNMIFAELTQELLSDLQQRSFFYVFDRKRNLARFVTSFDTTAEDIERFLG